MKSYFFLLLFLTAAMFLPACKSGDADRSGKDPQQMQSQGSDQAQSNVEYRAVCTDTTAHGGNEYILTKWLDNRDKVLPYANEHESKNKGHVVRIEEREKQSSE